MAFRFFGVGCGRFRCGRRGHDLNVLKVCAVGEIDEEHDWDCDRYGVEPHSAGELGDDASRRGAGEVRYRSPQVILRPSMRYR